MSKRCELQKEYYQQYGNYKGNGKYSDEYVSWLEEQILALRIHDAVGRSEQLCRCHDPMNQTNVMTGEPECYYCGGKR
jgi:hypothetical protein